VNGGLDGVQTIALVFHAG
jgi:hypothetical protein